MAEYLVITDTSCLILLDNIHALDLLHSVFPNVLTTPEVADEFGQPLPEWITISPAKNDLTTKYLQFVDLGEASAISLASELSEAILVIDDLKGRRLATQLQLRYTGTISVLIIARRQLMIKSLRPHFELIKATNFRIDRQLLDRILLDFND